MAALVASCHPVHVKISMKSLHADLSMSYRLIIGNKDLLNILLVWSVVSVLEIKHECLTSEYHSYRRLGFFPVLQDSLKNIMCPWNTKPVIRVHFFKLRIIHCLKAD